MAKPKTCKACKYEFHIAPEYMKKWRNYLMVCPRCLETFCVMKPETERTLQRLQYRYCGSSGRVQQKIYDELYIILLSYCQSLIKKHYSNLITDSYFLEEKSIDAVHFLLEEFLKYKNYRITISFGGFLQYKIKQVIFGKIYHDTAPVSLNFEMDDGNQIQYEDKKDLLKDIEHHEDKNLTAEYCSNLIINYAQHCEDKRENFLRLIAFKFFLAFGEKIADNFFRVFGRYGKQRYEETIMLLKHELKRLHKESGAVRE